MVNDLFGNRNMKKIVFFISLIVSYTSMFCSDLQNSEKNSARDINNLIIFINNELIKHKKPLLTDKQEQQLREKKTIKVELYEHITTEYSIK